MKLDIGGDETIQAPVEALWQALNDPAVLTRCIPGCRSMTEIAPDAYRVEMQLRVAAVGGSFEGEIALSDKEPPRACSIKVSGAGTLGHGNGSARSRSRRTDPTPRRLTYKGVGEIGGLVAGVGQRHPEQRFEASGRTFFLALAQGIRGAGQGRGEELGRKRFGSRGMNKIYRGACLQRCVALGGRSLRPQAPEPLSIVVFGAPSLGAFLPPIIKAQKFDEKNGLAIKFEERTPDAYTAQFNSGEFQLGGSASLLTVGLADTRGVKVTYLFNLFDFWGAVVTSRPDIKTVEGSRRQGPRRGQGHHQLCDVRLVRAPARRRHREIFGHQYRDPGPDRLCDGRSRRRRAAMGAGLHDVAVEEARHADHRSRNCRKLEEIHRQPQHSLSRRRRPHRLGGKEPEADPEALCRPTRKPPNGSRPIRTMRPS